MIPFETDVVSPPSDVGVMDQHVRVDGLYPQISSAWGVEARGDCWGATRAWSPNSNHNLLNNLLLEIAASEQPPRQIRTHAATAMITKTVDLQVISSVSEMSRIRGSSSVTTDDIYYATTRSQGQDLPTFTDNMELRTDLYDSAQLPPLTDLPLELQLRYLEVAYAFTDNPLQSSGFLEAHPRIVDLLYAAVQPLRRTFPESRFTVRIDGVPNPGIEESPEALLVTIWTKKDPIEAWTLLHGFYDDWWVECCPFADGKLLFDVGFE